MKNTKYFFLIIMITLFGFMNLDGTTYTENFDTNGNWAGGIMTGYNAKTYTNSSAPGGLTFLADNAVRQASQDNTEPYSSPYAWRANRNTTNYVMAKMDLTVNGFSVKMAKWASSPNVNIEYSVNGGTDYTSIETINGSYFTGDKVYKLYTHTFGSPISPNTGSTIVIRFNTTSGERMLYDDFIVDYVVGNVAPSISNINLTPATNITSSQAVSVSADVTDNDGTLTTVVLNWGTTSGSLTTQINMTLGAGDTYTTVSNIPAQLNNTTVYYEIYALDNESGESTSTEASYTVADPLPLTADFSASATTIFLGSSITFTNTTTGGVPSYSYSWNFGDTNTSILENPTHAYTSIGTYTVSLTVTDGVRGSDTVTKTDYITVEEAPAGATDLFFSEYIEGSSENKAIEIFNGTGAPVDLSAYSLSKVSNGGSWGEQTLALSGTLVNNEVFVIANSNSVQDILDVADLTENYVFQFNGDDAIALVKNSVIIDVIGTEGDDPGTGWPVAGTTNATVNHTLVRKSSVASPTTDWTTSAGTNATDSQWIVNSQDDSSNLGSHTFDGAGTTPTVVATPAITPTAGEYNNEVEVTIATTTAGATIYYTTDGNDPTTASDVYSEPFTLTADATVKAYATKTDYDDSEVATAIYTITDNATATTDLFFSEYIEGDTGNNKAVEIFNGTGSDIDFSNIAYSIKLGVNGQDWGTAIDLTGTIYNNSTYVVANDNSGNDSVLISATDQGTDSISFNGNDAVGLFKGTTLIDVIGLYQNDPSTAWDVAGTDEATMNHVLIRKQHIAEGNTDWASSAGTDASDSEWTVISPIVYSNLGSHTFAPLTADFSANVTSTTVGTTITFTAVVTGGLSGYSLEWDFDNDGTVDSEITTPSHIYNQAGTYSVSLHVTDANSDEKTVTKAGYITVESNMVYTSDLIISEYLSGTGNNKSVEIYNGTGQTVDLSDYSIQIATAGGSWATTIALSGSLINDDVFVIAHTSASSSIDDQADLKTASLNYAGNQAVGLFKSTTALDIVGVPGALPSGNGWTVANVANATYNRTIVRKSHISAGNTDSAEWTGTKAGETTSESEWIVFAEDDATNLGTHDYDFGDNTLPVTLTSFTSTITYSGLGQPFVSIQWKTEAESGLIGYNILRSESSNLDSAVRVNQEIVGASNSLIGNNYNYVDQQVELHNTYYYWLESVELSNENETFGPINIRVENNNSNGVTIPYQTTLRSVYPNPFNPTATVSFYVKNPDRVKIKVYNVKGQQIKELDNNIYQPGFHKLNWNGKDQNGNDCASGIYFFRMETKDYSQMIKGILMK